ncbi:MAG: methyl-accepting chemotaxis protein [Myxococcota bacterium]|nr:methyl-accepting chemotaxis protein [Myxococcota bacterium]
MGIRTLTESGVLLKYRIQMYIEQLKRKLIFNVKIVNRIRAGFIAMLVLMAGAGFIGINGLGTVSKGVEHLVGPVEKTSTVVAECVIDVNDQMTVAGQLTSGVVKGNPVIDVQNKQKVISEKLEKAFSHGVLKEESKKTLYEYKAEYDEYLDAMIQMFLAFQQGQNDFRANSMRLSIFFDKMLEQDESAAQLAMWHYKITQDIGKMAIGIKSPSRVEGMVEDSFMKQEEAADEILDSGAFDGILDDSDETYRDAYITKVERLAEATEKYIEGYSDFMDANEEFNDSAEEFRDAILVLNDATADEVTTVVKEVESANTQAKALMTLTLGVGIAVGLMLTLLIGRSISLPLRELINRLRDIAEGEGDLTQRIESNSEDEIGEVAHWFDLFLDKIQNTIQQVGVTTHTLKDAARDMLNGATRMKGSAG